MNIRTEILRDKKQRGKLLQLIEGLLIGLEIKDKQGRRMVLSDDLRLCYVGVDQDGGEHLIAIWTEGFVDFRHFETILDNISADEWMIFASNIGLNHIHEK